MKILHVIATMDPTHGGPIQGVRSYVNEFYRLSFKNEVVCLDEPGKPFHKVGFILHAVGPCKRPWCYTSKLRPWLRKNLQRFDVVLVHGLWLYHGYAVTKEVEALRRQSTDAKVPKVFVMPHGMLDPYFQDAPGRRLKAIRNILYWKWIESKVINKADGLLFTCEEELLLARTTFKNYHPRKELNILYGISTPPRNNASIQNTFQRLYPELAEKPYILFLSRIHEKKGLDLLIEAYDKVFGSKALQVGDSTAKDLPLLVIAGPGKESSYGQKLEKMVDDLNLGERVIFPGMLSGEVKWGAFYNCSAFVLPSHQENFGIAVAEALACSKPVLISKKINIWREIDACSAGLMDEDTLEGTTNLLSKWKILNFEKKKEMEVNARHCYETNFAISPATLRMLQTFI